jgi:hypothetical protein
VVGLAIREQQTHAGIGQRNTTIAETLSERGVDGQQRLQREPPGFVSPRSFCDGQSPPAVGKPVAIEDGIGGSGRSRWRCRWSGSARLRRPGTGSWCWHCRGRSGSSPTTSHSGRRADTGRSRRWRDCQCRPGPGRDGRWRGQAPAGPTGRHPRSSLRGAGAPQCGSRHCAAGRSAATTDSGGLRSDRRSWLDGRAGCR